MSLDSYFHEVSAALAATPRPAMQAVEQAIWQAYERDGTIFIIGNGGSAASASHLACDLQKWTIRAGQPRVRALALTDNVPVMSAWANDTAYERLFVEQLIVHYRPGDALVSISGSGNSPSILRAVEWANAAGAVTIGISGFSGGQLAAISQVSLVVPNHVMPQVEDVHMTLCHALAVSVGERIKQR